MRCQRAVEAVPSPNIGIYVKSSATVPGARAGALILLQVTDPQAMMAALKEKVQPSGESDHRTDR